MPNPTDENRFLSTVLRENESAVLYVRMLGEITQTIDDLYDQDKDVDPDEIGRVFWQCLVAMPCNAFYQEHFVVLQPQFQLAYFDWLNANELERGSEHDQTLSFVLRDNLVGLVVTCARLIGGYEYAKQVGPAIRRYFHDERLDQYQGNLPVEADEHEEGLE